MFGWVVSMCRKALCTIEEFMASFPTVGDAFYWFGASTYEQLLDREAEIAKARPSRRADTGPPCDGQGEPAYMVFDVETDGGSPKQLAIQLAYIVFNREHMELFRYDKLLSLPPGKKINWHSIKIHHITDNMLRLRGVDPTPEIRLFFDWVDKVHSCNGNVIAHNAAFDAACVTNTAAQHALPYELKGSECFCTMRSATNLCGLVDKRGRPKPPKNKELYSHLHDGRDPEEWARLHDALDDVRVTASSFKAGCERGWWR